MKDRLWATAVAAPVLFSGGALAAEYGTAEEARPCWIKSLSP